MVDAFLRNPLYFIYIISLNSVVTILGVFKIIQVYRKPQHYDIRINQTTLKDRYNFIDNGTVSFLMISIHMILIIAYSNITQPHYSLIIEEAVPAHWYYYQSSHQSEYSQRQLLDIIDDYKNQIYLPDNTKWLENQKYPLLVVSNIHFEATTNLSQISLVAPNVVLIVMESLTTQHFMNHSIRTDVLKNNSYVIQNFIDKQKLPYLYKIAESSVSFFNMRSNGLPTINGWHSLFTGQLPSLHSYNMIQGVMNHFDDIPSYFKNLDYQTLLVWPTPLQFDKMHNFAFRGYQFAPKSKFNNQFHSFPKLFDQIVNHCDAFCLQANKQQMPRSNWIPDRLSSTQLIKHFELMEHNKSVFAMYGTVDTHSPYLGYDSVEQYSHFHSGLLDRYADINQRYMSMMNYSSYYVWNIIEYLRTSYPNTIIVITGDHGARDLKLNDFQNKQWLRNNVATDAYFKTGAFISYLGGQKTDILMYINSLINKTFTFDCDHQDLIFTLQTIISTIQQRQFISGRIGQNLLQLTEDVQMKMNLLINSKFSIQQGYIEIVVNSSLTIKRNALKSYQHSDCKNKTEIANLWSKQLNYYKARQQLGVHDQLFPKNVNDYIYLLFDKNS